MENSMQCCAVPVDVELVPRGTEEGEFEDEFSQVESASTTTASNTPTPQWTNMSRRASSELELHHIFSELFLACRCELQRLRLVWLDLSLCADDVFNTLHSHLELLSELRYLDVSHPNTALHHANTVRQFIELLPLLASLRVLRVHATLFVTLVRISHASATVAPLPTLRRLVVVGVSTTTAAALLSPPPIGGPFTLSTITAPALHGPALHLVCEPQPTSVSMATVDGRSLAAVIAKILQTFPWFGLPLGGTVVLSNAPQEAISSARRHLGIFRVVGDDAVSTERIVGPRRGSNPGTQAVDGTSDVARRQAMRLAAMQALDEPAFGESAAFQLAMKTAYDSGFREFADIDLVVTDAAQQLSPSSTPTELLRRPVHRIVLWLRCPRLLRTLLKGALRAARRHVAAMEALLRFVYTDCVDIGSLEAEDIHCLRELAVLYALPRLVAVCDFVTATAEAAECGGAAIPRPPPPPTIALDLARAFGDQSGYADIALVIGPSLRAALPSSEKDESAPQRLVCSRYVLSCVSRYFRAMFTSQLHEATLESVPLGDVTSAPIAADVWEVFLHALHGEPLGNAVTMATVAPLAHLGHVLGVDYVCAACTAFVHRTLSVDTAFQLLHQAYIYNAEDLFEIVERFFQSHAEELWVRHLDNGGFERLDEQVFREAFVSTTFNYLADISGADYVEANTEATNVLHTPAVHSAGIDSEAIHRLECLVFRAVLCWLKRSRRLISNCTDCTLSSTDGIAQRLWDELNENWLDRLHVERLSLADYGRCLYEIFPAKLVDQVFGLTHEANADSECPHCQVCNNRGYVSTVSRCSCGSGCARCSFSPDTFVPVFRTCSSCARGEVARARDLFYRMAFRPLHLKVPLTIAHRRTSIIAT